MIGLFAVLIIVIIIAIIHRPAKAERGVDNPAVGFCGPVNSDDSRVFGPYVWPALHMMAHYYPESPSATTRARCRAFIEGLIYMLPCSKCGKHFKDFLELNEQNAGQADAKCMGAESESVCRSLDDICASKANLVDFMVRAHNNVNSHVHPDRKRFTVADASKLWKDKDICVHFPKWGGEPLDR